MPDGCPGTKSSGAQRSVDLSIISHLSFSRRDALGVLPTSSISDGAAGNQGRVRHYKKRFCIPDIHSHGNAIHPPGLSDSGHSVRGNVIGEFSFNVTFVGVHHGFCETFCEGEERGVLFAVQQVIHDRVGSDADDCGLSKPRSGVRVERGFFFARIDQRCAGGRIAAGSVMEKGKPMASGGGYAGVVGIHDVFMARNKIILALVHTNRCGDYDWSGGDGAGTFLSGAKKKKPSAVTR